MTEINNLNELDNNDIEIVMFTMPTCGPCKMMKPALEMVKNKLKNFELYEIDASKNFEVARELGVSSTPTVLYIKDGVEVQRSVGYETLPAITNRVNAI